MNRSGIKRFLATSLILLHGGMYGAVAILDAQVAARANAAVSHVEEAGASGAGCLSHDEATCQLCRAGSTTGCGTPGPCAMLLVPRSGRPITAAQPSYPVVEWTALHSRAPPVA